MLQNFNFSTNYFLATLLILGLVSCNQDSLMEFKVIEPIGIARDLEYIQLEWETDIEPQENTSFYIASKEKKISGQILSINPTSNGNFKIKALFPVQINANETMSYSLLEGSAHYGDTLTVSGAEYDLVIYNKYFTADLRANRKNPSEPLSAGQVSTIAPTNVDGILFKRNNINIHWSPNFQRLDSPYRTLSHLNNGIAHKKVGPYLVQIEKEGFVDGYPELQINSSYTFFAGLPFFIFSSEVLAKEDVRLSLLRNDEMTMDSLFTHVFHNSNGKAKALPLYEEATFSLLEENPIPDDVSWLAFTNQDKEYLMGCIRLDYDNNNLDGKPSPLYKPHTKITAAANNGRYWNRRLIHDHDTLVPNGSKYFEKNAYFTGFSPDSLESTVSKLHRGLENPLKVVIDR